MLKAETCKTLPVWFILTDGICKPLCMYIQCVYVCVCVHNTLYWINLHLESKMQKLLLKRFEEYSIFLKNIFDMKVW